MTSTQQLDPIDISERIEVVDVLRGLAIAGILIGNMQWFTGYGQAPPAVMEQWPAADRIVNFLVHFLVEGKFYSIFSLLFGFGFALQIARAEQRGDAKASVFKRRFWWLFVIGALHGFLLWAGDILAVYAVMGFVLLLFRLRPERSLIKWAVILMIVPVVWYALLAVLFVAFAPPETSTQITTGMAEMYRQNIDVISDGGYGKILTAYNLPYLAGRWIGLVIQMRLPKILAMFLLGVYVYRKGYLQNIAANVPAFRRVVIYGGLLGIVGNLALAAFAGNEGPAPPSVLAIVGVAGYGFGVPAMALAIAAAVVLLSHHRVTGRLLSFAAPVGRMAMTNYLLQTLVCITIFYGYGFGLFGSVGATTATLIALVIFAGQTVFSTVWLSFFAYGPMEWVWRQLTYKRRLPLTRTSAAAARA